MHRRMAQRATVGPRRPVCKAMLGPLSVDVCWKEMQATAAVPAAEVRFEKAGRRYHRCVAVPQALRVREAQAVAEAPEDEVELVAAAIEGFLLLLPLHLLLALREVRCHVEEGPVHLQKTQKTGEREERSGQVRV